MESGPATRRQRGFEVCDAIAHCARHDRNTGGTSESERRKDFRTKPRSCDSSRGRVHASRSSSVLVGELALLTLLALPAGLLIGTQFARSLVEAASTETVRLPLILTSRTYATAVLIVLLSSGVSFAMVGRRIRNLDLLGVLKARD